MPLFPDDAVLCNHDLVGPQKLFGSQPALDDAVEKHGFPVGRFVGGMRKRSGFEVNRWWDSRPTEKLDRSAANDARQRKRRTIQPSAAS
jgi:hypothetical protein